MPKARKPSVVSNYQFLCALLYIIENGCKWRAGTILRIFEQLQDMNIIDNRTDVLCIDSTYVKVHPDGTGALKKVENKA